MKNSINKNESLMKKMLNIPENKLNKEVIEKILKNIVSWVESQDLYNESSWIVEEYKQLHHSLNSLYSFIYTPNKSNLSLDDAKVFASYAVSQSKKLKNIVNILANNKS